jgi:integrase
LCALDVGDLATDATSCYVDVRQGKGHKDRQVPVSEDVYTLMLAYLAATGRAVWATADRATPLFLSRNRHNAHGGRLSERQAQAIVEDCARRAGLLERGKRITPHSLRHSYGIGLIKGDTENGRPGAPLPAVAKMMGHSSVAVTGRYLNHFERGELSAYAPRLRRGQTKREGE